MTNSPDIQGLRVNPMDFTIRYYQEVVRVVTTKAKLGVVMLQGCRCRCGHEWLPRGEEKPRVCPKCKSANWDRPKQERL